MANGGKVVVKIDGDTSGFKNAMGKLKGVAGTAAKAIGVGFTAAATAVGAIGTAAVKAQGEYEQLVGGIETLFGTGGQTVEEYAVKVGKSVSDAAADYEKLTSVQETMIDRAHSAFERAGVSANTYMETATSFAASLVSSLGGDTVKAADYADQAIIDMSDNANKMGTAIESIQWAYQGFAKQNYTMLDNLKLGYGGTQEEMKRLVRDAAAVDKSINANSLSFDNVVKAIHVVQEQMGITGTTAKEAATTLQGSLGMTKAAWENLMVALANPDADLDEALNDLINSAKTFASNLLPVIKQVLSTLPTAISELGVEIANGIPSLVAEILPALVDGAAELINAVVATLPGLVDAVTGVAPDILNAVVQLFADITAALPGLMNTVMQAIADLIPVAFETVLNTVLSLADNIDEIITAFTDNLPAIVQSIADSLIDYLPLLIQGLVTLVLALVDALPEIMQAFADATPVIWEGIVASLLESLPVLIAGLFELIVKLPGIVAGMVKAAFSSQTGIFTGMWEGVKTAFAPVGEWIGEKVNEIKDVFVNAWGGIVSFFETVKNTLINGFMALIQWFIDLPQKVAEMKDKIVEFFAELPEKIGETIGMIAGKLATWATDLVNWAKTAIPTFIENIVTFFRELPGKIWDVCVSAFDKISSWGQNVIDWIGNAIPSMVNAVVGFFKSLPGLLWGVLATALAKIKSWGQNIASWASSAIPSICSEIVGFFRAIPSQMASIGRNIVTGLWNGISGAAGWLAGKVKGFCSSVVQGFKNNFSIHSPSRVMRDEVGKMLVLGMADGISDNKNTLLKQMDILSKQAIRTSIDAIKSHANDFVKTISDMLTDTRSEVQKARDEIYAPLLESEKRYQDESARVEIEQKEFQKRIDAEKNSERQQALRDELEIKKEADKKYLDTLNTAAKNERKIYTALQKDIENSQKSILNSIEELSKSALSSIEEVEKLQSTMQKKLSDYGDLYTKQTKERYGKTFEVISLADLSKQTDALTNYADMLLRIKERGNVPQEFFAMLRDMSVEEGMKYAEALLNADDVAFNKYIDDWKAKQATAENLSKILYVDEAEEVKSEIAEAFDKFDTDLDQQGRQNAAAWGNGFYEKVKSIIPSILDEINSAFGNIIGIPTYAIAGNSSGGTIDLNKLKGSNNPIVVNSVIELDGREVGRSVGGSVGKENNRRGSNFLIK